MTSRRAFLASLGAAFALDPERALWVLGAKTISVPAPCVCRFCVIDRQYRGGTLSRDDNFRFFDDYAQGEIEVLTLAPLALKYRAGLIGSEATAHRTNILPAARREMRDAGGVHVRA